jgi:pimeloyl-ACP methyl ester carboxylesterase
VKATDASTLDVAGVPLRVRISGPEDAPVILLVHGIARSLEDWSEAHDLLAVDHRVISTDLPGFGYSRKGRERPGLPAFGRAMAALLDAAGVSTPVHVMGNSLGGGVAMTLAVDHPGKVASLTLVNSIGFGSEVNISMLPMTYGVLAALPGLGRTFGPKAREAGANTIRDLFFDRELATVDQLKHAGKLARQADFRGTFLGVAATLSGPTGGVRTGWRRALLARVTASGIPVLVIWGDADKILPPHHLEAAAAALPNARTHLFVDTGHMPQVERAVDFVDVVSAFVADVQASPDVEPVETP